jgi:inosine-uridine nucleoside N-ribohydrolase
VTLPVLIDTDPGIDDAIAILFAGSSPELDIVGVTTVVGNSPVVAGTEHARRLLHLLGRDDVAVAMGADRPFAHAPRDFVGKPSQVHGATGLGNLDLPPATREVDGRPAVELIRQAAIDHAGELVIIAIGPLTNIAMFVALYPDEARLVRKVVVMGGSVREGGNYSPGAEFNFYTDPAAARRVFDSGLDVTVLGLDVTHQAVLNSADVEVLRGAGGPVAAAAVTLLEFYLDWHIRTYGVDSLPMHDSLAVAVAINEKVVELKDVYIDVQIDTGPLRGVSVVDLWGLGDQPPNVKWAIGVDADGFHELLLDRLTT